MKHQSADKTFRPARAETFEHTITGLLTKRADLFKEAERARDRLAETRTILERWTGLGRIACFPE